MAGPHSEALGPGDRLGPYRIVRLLGSGGMGTVHEAVEEGLARRVALKLIAPAVADDPGFRERFAHEARALARLDSPHVVQVFAHGDLDGRLFLATQLVPDGDLRRLLAAQGPPAVEVALDLVAQVADGLAEVHRVGLVHRDVKPANVLLRNRGPALSAYLADFGLACPTPTRPGPDAQSLTPPAPRYCAARRTGGVRLSGTPSRQAPELWRGEPPSPSSDVYALGCLLWEVLTGRTPYDAPDEPAMARAHAVGAIPQLQGRSRGVRGINRILRRALAKDPGERYPLASGLRDDIRRLHPRRIDHIRPARQRLG